MLAEILVRLSWSDPGVFVVEALFWGEYTNWAEDIRVSIGFDELLVTLFL